MRRAHVQPLAAMRIHPARGDAPAGKYQGMRPILIEDGQLDIAVDRRGRYGLPHLVSYRLKLVTA